jgi:hypothetical protein
MPAAEPVMPPAELDERAAPAPDPVIIPASSGPGRHHVILASLFVLALLSVVAGLAIAFGLTQRGATPEPAAHGLAVDEVEPPANRDPFVEHDPAPAAAEPDDRLDEEKPAQVDDAEELDASAIPTGRCTVEMVANDYRFIYIKLGSRPMTLEPRKTVRLAVDRYSVSLRRTPDAEWIRVGTLDCEAKRRYRIEALDPLGVRIERTRPRG